MAFDHPLRNPEHNTEVFDKFGIAFLSLFMIEAIIKVFIRTQLLRLIDCGPRLYF